MQGYLGKKRINKLWIIEGLLDVLTKTNKQTNSILSYYKVQDKMSKRARTTFMCVVRELSHVALHLQISMKQKVEDILF